LCYAHRRQNIHQAKIITNFIMQVFKWITFSLGGKMLCPFGQFFIIGNNHATAAGSYYLIAIKTKTTHRAECTRMSAFIRSSQCFCRVFHNL
jgi:hypothetical protein